jgi:hypothetical protein
MKLVSQKIRKCSSLDKFEKSVVLIHLTCCRYRLNPNFFTAFVLQVRPPYVVVGIMNQRVVLYSEIVEKAFFEDSSL